MLLEDAVSFIQHYNTLIYNTDDLECQQRLVIMKQDIISEFISAKDSQHHRKEPNAQTRSPHTLLSTRH